MLDFLALHLLEFSKTYIYPVIFLGILIEGDIFLFVSGYLVSNKLFSPVVIFPLAFVAAATGDLICFFIGKNIEKVSGKFKKIVERTMCCFDNSLRKRTFITIFLSKFIYGFHFLFLIRSGMIGISLRRFLKSDFPSAVLWILIISSLGFLSGTAFNLFGKYVKYTEICLLLGLLIFIFIRKLVDDYIKDEFKKNNR